MALNDNGKEAMHQNAEKEAATHDAGKEAVHRPADKEHVRHEAYAGKEALNGNSPGADSERQTSFEGNGGPFVINGELVPDPDAGLSDEERARHERALLWKLDLRLIPWLSLLYLISFLDREYCAGSRAPSHTLTTSARHEHRERKARRPSSRPELISRWLTVQCCADHLLRILFALRTGDQRDVEALPSEHLPAHHRKRTFPGSSGEQSRSPDHR